MPNAVPDGRFAAQVGPGGDLHIDPAHVAAVSHALAGVDVEHLRCAEATRRSVVQGLAQVTARVGGTAGTMDRVEARAALQEVTARMEEFLPYGVLAKFVPDVLWGLWREPLEEPPSPRAEHMPGVRLARRLVALGRGCRAAGVAVESLPQIWPDVPAPVGRAITRFARAHVGDGPLQWDAPGFDDPEYVCRAVASTAAIREERLARRSATRGPIADTRRSIVASWIRFLEQETHRVREAFFRGMVPLLRRLASLGSHDPSLLLFATADELARDAFDADRAEGLRMRYLLDASYRHAHGIGPERLGRIVEPV